MWQLAPELLKLTRRPFRPALADATFLSWPLLSAACALRLLAYIEPEPPTSTGVVSSGAAFDLAGCGIAPSLVREAAEELFSYEDPFEALRAYAKLGAPTKLALLTIMVDAASGGVVVDNDRIAPNDRIAGMVAGGVVGEGSVGAS